jgi:hypothetical protein
VQVFAGLARRASWQDARGGSSDVVLQGTPAADLPATHAQLCGRGFAPSRAHAGDPLRLEDLALHAIVPPAAGAVSANVATLIFARTRCASRRCRPSRAGASRARVIAQIVTEGLVLALAAAVLGLVVAQTTVRYAWPRRVRSLGTACRSGWI